MWAIIEKQNKLLTSLVLTHSPSHVAGLHGGLGVGKVLNNTEERIWLELVLFVAILAK